MKKLFSFLTALLCAVALTSPAFASDADAYALYQKYLKKMKYVMSMEFSYSEKDYDGNGDGYAETSGMTMTAKTLMPPNRKLQMSIKAFNIETGETAELYVKDGYGYLRAPDNEKTKEKVNTNYYMTVSEFINDIISPDLTRNDFKDAIVEKVDGGTKITFKEKSSSGVPYRFSSVNIVVGDDGILRSYSESETRSYAFDKEHTYKKKTIKSLKVKSADSITEIDFPADLNAY